MGEINHSKIPWVEKYKPTDFAKVILSDTNRRLFSNIIETKEFPNVLFYGPPGTGKTTTIINMVKKYHEELKQKHNALTIHLNASDDRGVDVVRTQIHQFVNTKQLFFPGMKFVILDEVDYMTNSAQQALRHLIQTNSTNNVRFCLICNYVGKINDGLQNDFIKIRFNQLPVPNILAFLKNISVCENINISDAVLENIQSQFRSDIRSMINTMQIYSEQSEYKIIDSSVYGRLFQNICSKVPSSFECANIVKKSLNIIVKQIKEYSVVYNTSETYIIKELVKYLVWTERNNPKSPAFLTFAETIFHNENSGKYINKIIMEIRRLRE